MTRTLLFALALLFAVPAASAQSTIGLRAGLNTSFWSGTNSDITQADLGFVGGLAGRFQATPSLGIQGEVLYSQKGVRDDNSIDNEGSYNLSYIEIPVVARVSVPISPFADAGVFAGPAVSIPVRAAFDYDVEIDGDDSDDLMEEVQTEFGIVVGADYYAGPVGVDLRYTAGVSNVFSDDTLEDTFVDVKNQVFSVTLGYRFGG